MRHASHVLIFLGLVLAELAAATRPTTRPDENPAKRIARDLSRYLRDARVHSVEVRLNNEADPRLLIDDRDEVAALLKSFFDALAADDLQEGKQWHRPWGNVHIRFVIEEGPDVRLNSIGLDMFWAAKSDEEPRWKPKWVNLQTPALTNCFRTQLDAVWPTTRPSSGARD